jgi:hypothetical protein
MKLLKVLVLVVLRYLSVVCFSIESKVTRSYETFERSTVKCSTQRLHTLSREYSMELQ